MAERQPDFKNILVIHFGQLGDVVLALPAFRAIRGRFPEARITALTGKVAGEVVALSRPVDDVLAIDRVELRDGPKLRSISKIVSLTRDIRSRRFDLIVDLHSLKETNVLAWLSGADKRLLSNRGNRSFHSLGNFAPPPPDEDRSLHLSETYMRVLTPLGVDAEPKPVVINAREQDRKDTLQKTDRTHRRAGIFPGAGHPSRCWSLDNFGELSAGLLKDGYAPVIFLGPEEHHLRAAISSVVPEQTQIVEGLTIPRFIAAASELDIFVTNDTGPMHLAALAGAPILLVMDARAPLTYLPLAEHLKVVNTAQIDDITVDEVHSAARELLQMTKP